MSLAITTLAAFVAGFLTVLSPCILPVLPFVFARSDRPFAQGTLPLLAGLVASFALVASLGAVAGARAGWGSARLVRAGGRRAATQDGRRWRGSLLLGLATGLIWTPCAGPVL